MQPEPSNVTEAASRLERTEQYLKSDPGNRNLLATAIDQCLELGRLEAAAGHAEAALARFPEDAVFQSLRGNVLMAQQRWDDAAAVFAPLLAVHADMHLAYNLAYCYFWLARYADAAQALAPFGSAADIWPEAVTLLLRVLHHAGRMDEAVALAAIHESHCGTDHRFLSVASLVYMDAGDAAQAERLSQAALADPVPPLEALMVSGSMALARFDAVAAVERFGQVIARYPQEGRSWAGLGMSSLLVNDLSTARTQLEQAVKFLPSHIGSWHLLGWCRLFEHDLAGARQVFEQALAMDRNFGESHGALAVVQAQLGEREPAAKSIERALGLDPRGLSARYAQMILAGDTVDPLAFRQLAFKLLSSQKGVFDDDLGKVVQGVMQQSARSGG
ncbi:tetratricopeptide repeat protein [Janthinobacterium sp. SUN128]|uniref:tetratricopeptide repeat protein n=1 Tax=Janthinobacterium sp. SUN128 TaxID=3014790 RepID=UPI00271235D9|nr:tetratricopeptide repeat protein [Janthinobacterium sp. SUN128]MDO8033528.1 tetratricopeptide repeat protein [Janthinobacterium sp. SUN128]